MFAWHILDSQGCKVSSCEQRRLIAQADLCLILAHISEGTFSHVVELFCYIMHSASINLNAQNNVCGGGRGEREERHLRHIYIYIYIRFLRHRPVQTDKLLSFSIFFNQDRLRKCSKKQGIHIGKLDA